jgi:hypothetical protein
MVQDNQPQPFCQVECRSTRLAFKMAIDLRDYAIYFEIHFFHKAIFSAHLFGLVIFCGVLGIAAFTCGSLD